MIFLQDVQIVSLWWHIMRKFNESSFYRFIVIMTVISHNPGAPSCFSIILLDSLFNLICYFCQSIDWFQLTKPLNEVFRLVMRY